MIKLLKTTDEIETIYPELYERCFGKKIGIRLLPPIVFLAIDIDIIGFSAGYAFNESTMYINSSGMLPEYRTKKRAATVGKEFNRAYKEMGFKHLMGYVENTNKRAIFTALQSGYLITGCRVSSKGKVFVIITQDLGADHG